MHRKKVLIITYYWPPASSPGVYRFLKFTRYLRDFGWEPIILTVKNGSYPSIDYTLLHEIPDDLTIYHSSTIEPFAIYKKLTGKKGKSIPVGISYNPKEKGVLKKIMFYIRANYFIPDARKGWTFFAKRKAKKIIQRENIDAVITTGPPHSTHLTGLYLKKTFGIPWIADFRDPWTTIYYNETFPRTKKTNEKDYRLESKVLKQADVVTVVCNGLKQEFEDRTQKIEVIYNGFDQREMPEKKEYPTNNFNIDYIGNFLASENIPMIWEALKELQEVHKTLKEDVQITITGNIDPVVNKTIQQYGIGDMINTQSFIPHVEALKKMTQSNLLLFVVPDSKNNHLIITGKLFEYLASQTPILAIGPPQGEAGVILSENKRDQMIDYTEKELFKKILLKHYHHWINNDKKAEKSVNTNLYPYTREGLTKQLSELLNQLTKRRP